MKRNRAIAPVLGIVLAIGATLLALPAAAQNQFVGIDPETGLSAAVVVENKALAHTAQLLPVDPSGAVVGADIDTQLGQVVKNMATVLGELGSGLDAIARLNVYVASDDLAAQTTGLLKKHLGPNAHPAVTLIVAALEDSKALVAADAIAAVSDDKAPSAVLRHTSAALPARNGIAHVAVLPKGRTLYVSGMSEQVQDFDAAFTGTMKQLHGVLDLNGLSPEHVVHLKAFMKPVADAGRAEKAMAAFYPGGLAPPVTFVNWLNALPDEIELIAWLPGDGGGMDPVQHRWPAHVTPSPVYCRYAIANSPTRIYTKGFTARTALDAAGQVHDIFAQLTAALEPLGSDFRHMVKGTYYVTAEDTSTALNQIRPEYYDPQRPPAASKATVAGIGMADRGLVLDMIAVPK